MHDRYNIHQQQKVQNRAYNDDPKNRLIQLLSFLRALAS